MSFIVSVAAVVAGEALLSAYIITAASLVAAVGSFLALRRQGKKIERPWRSTAGHADLSVDWLRNEHPLTWSVSSCSW